jgi:hypothetical protein
LGRMLNRPTPKGFGLQNRMQAMVHSSYKIIRNEVFREKQIKSQVKKSINFWIISHLVEGQQASVRKLCCYSRRPEGNSDCFQP